MAYFDNAATSYPKPDEVYNFTDKFYRNYGGNAGRGNYKLAYGAKQIIDETRNILREILHAPAKEIIFTPTATIALNMIIQGVILRDAKNIYVSPFEHNAVTRTLYHFEKIGKIKVDTLAVKNSLQYDLTRIKYQFEELPPDFVIVSHASNVIGLIAPVEKIFAQAQKYNAVTLVDMAQTAGLVEFNAGLDTVDFAVFAGHKTLFAPTGIAGFLMTPKFNLPPIIFGGTGYDSANLEMPETLPQKYEAGTLNIAGIAGLNAALKWIQAQTVKKIFQAEKNNRQKLLTLLQKYDFINIIGNNKNLEYVGIVSCTFDGISSDVAGNIFAERNIAVRAGLQCAPNAHKFLGTYPAGTVRFSVNIFNNDADFQELKIALDDIEKNL